MTLVKRRLGCQGANNTTNLCQAVPALEAHFLDSEPLIYRSSGHTIWDLVHSIAVLGMDVGILTGRLSLTHKPSCICRMSDIVFLEGRQEIRTRSRLCCFVLELDLAIL